MPTNSSSARRRAGIIGLGSNLDVQPCYKNAKREVRGVMGRLRQRLETYPETLFVRNPKTQFGWLPICAKPRCYTPLLNWDFAIAHKRECKKHRVDLRAVPSDPKNIRSPILRSLDGKGLLLRRPHRNTDKRKRGFSEYFVKCAVQECKREITAVEFCLRRRNCVEHRKRYLVAGHRTRSYDMWRDRKRIAAFKPYSSKSKTPVPWCKCEVKGCSSMVRWKPHFLDNRKLLIKCVPCKYKHGNLRPFENLYNSLKASAGQGGRKVSLTLAQFSELCKVNTCFYCNKTIVRRRLNARTKIKSTAHFLDRVQAHKGYSKNNVVVCCTQCNFTRNNWLSVYEMQIIGAVRQQNVAKVKALLKAPPAEQAIHMRKLSRILHLRLCSWGRR